MNIKSVKMFLYGFKKVALNDTKGVLNNTNNFKWVKKGNKTQITVLPSGTKVKEQFSTTNTNAKLKMVVKPSTQAYLKSIADNGAYKIYSAKATDTSTLKFKDMKIIKEKTFAEAIKENAEKLNKKRKLFINNFNKKFERTIIKTEDGSVTKLVKERATGKLVHWFRKDTNLGTKITGNISYGEEPNKVTNIVMRGL